MVFLPAIPRFLAACLVALLLVASVRPAGGQPPPPGRQIVADVVALDQVIMLNRRGASMPNGMVFALKRDVVPTSCYTNQDCTLGTTPLTLVPGQVMLRRDKRPRPLVLRVNVGDTLTINFWNLLNPKPVDPMQPATRSVSLHVMGMEWTRSSQDDGSLVDANPSSLVPPSSTPVPPGQPTQYVLYAKGEGSFLLVQHGRRRGRVPELRRHGQRPTHDRALRRRQRAAGWRALLPQPGHPQRAGARRERHGPRRASHHRLRGRVPGRLGSQVRSARAEHARREEQHRLQRPDGDHPADRSRRRRPRSMPNPSASSRTASSRSTTTRWRTRCRRFPTISPTRTRRTTAPSRT